jgi:hypothetical protein
LCLFLFSVPLFVPAQGCTHLLWSIKACVAGSSLFPAHAPLFLIDFLPLPIFPLCNSLSNSKQEMRGSKDQHITNNVVRCDWIYGMQDELHCKTIVTVNQRKVRCDESSLLTSNFAELQGTTSTKFLLSLLLTIWYLRGMYCLTYSRKTQFSATILSEHSHQPLVCRVALIVSFWNGAARWLQVTLPL